MLIPKFGSNDVTRTVLVELNIVLNGAFVIDVNDVTSVMARVGQAHWASTPACTATIAIPAVGKRILLEGYMLHIELTY